MNNPNAGSGATTESYAYDANSNVKTRVTRRGDMISFGYDTLNRLTTKTEPAGTPSVSYGYDLFGRLISVSDNGPALVAATPGTSFTESASYDALNRPVSMSWSPAAAQTTPTAASVAFSFAYDGSNRRVGQTANDNTWISYPGPAGTIAYTPNALNQYAKVGAVSPTHDANGNLTFDGTFTYAYDAESRLVSVAQGGSTVASYAYDGRGRRKSRTVGGTTTVYVTGAEDQGLLEYNGSTGAPGAIYAVNLGGGLDDVLNRVVPGGARQTLVPDVQGSIVASLASGGALTRIAYQAFGESPSAVAAGAGPRYTARRLDPETAIGGGAQPNGLYDYRARMYSPTWGRFLQPDPIGTASGGNLYAYVGNDPVNNTDPSGSQGIPGIVIGGIAGGSAGYIAGGWKGAFIGTFVGAGVGASSAPLSATTARIVLATTGSSALSATTAGVVFTAANAGAGAGATIATNLLEGKPAFQEVTSGALVGGLAPLLSGETVLVGTSGVTARGLPALTGQVLSAQTGIGVLLGTAATTFEPPTNTQITGLYIGPGALNFGSQHSK